MVFTGLYKPFLCKELCVSWPEMWNAAKTASKICLAPQVTPAGLFSWFSGTYIPS